MKNLIIGLVVAVLGVSLTQAALFVPSVTLDTTKAQNYTHAIDTFIEKFVSNKTDVFLEDTFNSIDSKITTMLKKTGLSDTTIFILEYIQYRGNNRLSDNSVNTGNDTGSSNDQSKTIDISKYDAGIKTISAGIESIPVAKFELNATLEKVELREFSIIASSDTFGDAIKYVRIYDKDGKLLATQRPNGTTATISNSNITLDIGSNFFYITLEPYAIGGGVEAPQTSSFTLKLRTDEAVGKTSNKTIASKTTSDTLDTITIAPIIISSIELVDSYQGYHVDSALYNNVKADLAIVKINIAESSSFNTTNSSDLKAILQTLTVKLYDGTQAANIANTLEIKRINSTSNAVMADVNGDLISFDLTSFTNDRNIISAGNYIVLMIRGTPSLDASKRETVKIELDNANAAVLAYTTTDNSAPTLTTESMQPTFIGSVSIHD